MQMPTRNRIPYFGLAPIAGMILAIVCTASAAQDKPDSAAVDRFVLTKVRVLPKPGTAALCRDERISGGLLTELT